MKEYKLDRLRFKTTSNISCELIFLSEAEDAYTSQKDIRKVIQLLTEQLHSFPEKGFDE